MNSRIVKLVGELAVLAGFVLCLHVVYQLWFTNFESDRQAAQVSDQLVEDFSKATKSVASTASEEIIEEADHGGFALLYIPALKNDVWALPILSDVTDADLALGAGHYPESALPGEIGNFAIAAHRATNGEPFAYFEELKAGDRVIVQTSQGFYTYELFADQKIQESEVWVISKQPAGIASSPTALITLTTCDPRWNSTQRWARWGQLVDFSITAPKELTQS
jgi:sortase A